ncbi:DUF2617 family protein [Dactylosporangium sucinum]|uniref:DUF2617 family protein n=1 Tax=Dactylosporangium sucinum TaxID=1424081 RepID=A0A917TNW7_9ACTN|nr:DUF2617 family protein [Dactylosporangium sucinum]GGM31154.1 hypothetical protein GCM10007977_035530 [Dactylosporangium sucinum]
MLVTLDTPYIDTTAADLRFALGLPPQPALRTLTVPLPGGEAVVLRLLGASHQVRFRDVDETVACLPALPAGLPASFARPGYTFTAKVQVLAGDAFAAACDQLRRRAAAEEHALAGAFPGARDALTVLAARPVPGGAAWWTAHAYPQTGELVTTETVVTAA